MFEIPTSSVTSGKILPTRVAAMAQRPGLKRKAEALDEALV